MPVPNQTMPVLNLAISARVWRSYRYQPVVRDQEKPLAVTRKRARSPLVGAQVYARASPVGTERRASAFSSASGRNLIHGSDASGPRPSTD